jgi:hypothetical protein
MVPQVSNGNTWSLQSIDVIWGHRCKSVTLGVSGYWLWLILNDAGSATSLGGMSDLSRRGPESSWAVDRLKPIFDGKRAGVCLALKLYLFVYKEKC